MAEENNTYTPQQLAELTKPKEEAKPETSADFLKTLQEANKFVGAVKSIISTGQSLLNASAGMKEGAGNSANKIEKEVNRQMAIKGSAPAGDTKPRKPNTEPVEKKPQEIKIDVKKVKTIVTDKLEMIGDEMTGKEAKDLIKPMLEGNLIDEQIKEAIKGVVSLE